MKFTILTLFPEFFESPLRAGLMGKAVEAGLVSFDFIDIRDFGEGRHKTTDDYPFGGGAGMVMKAGPVVGAIESLRASDEKARVILLTPQGRPFGQPDAKRLSALESVAFVCGRYEGFDERIRPFADEELSLGDFVLMGGEAAALAMADSIARLVPGVLGDLASTEEESMSAGLLEYPQ
ncbi:tRNA (guanosine(37)-N1)-methyltransferase TrmD, partial [bacterium]